MVSIKIVKDRKDLATFIELPMKIHQFHAKWTPPILADEWTFFDPKRNKNFDHSDTVLALALRDGEVVGRIMGIINHRFNRLNNDATARFGFLETGDDKEAALALLNFVEGWAKERGQKKIVGPLGFTDQDPEGFIIEGFDGDPTIATNYNFSFMPKFMEEKGFTKEVDYYVYKIKIQKENPAIYGKVLGRKDMFKDLKLKEFASTRDLRPYIIPILTLMNESFSHLYGYVPLSVEEMRDLAARYLPVINPKFVKAVETTDRKLVGFILGIPNMDEGFRKAKGRLLPLGVFHILRASKRSKQLDLLLGAIHKDYRNRAIDVMLGSAIINSAREAGFEFIDSHLELESNTKIRSEMERAGGKVCRRYRIFQKKL